MRYFYNQFESNVLKSNGIGFKSKEIEACPYNEKIKIALWDSTGGE